MKVFEYQRVILDDDYTFLELLNELGYDGWEIVNMEYQDYSLPFQYDILMKRKVEKQDHQLSKKGK